MRPSPTQVIAFLEVTYETSRRDKSSGRQDRGCCTHRVEFVTCSDGEEFELLIGKQQMMLDVLLPNSVCQNLFLAIGEYRVVALVVLVIIRPP
jgi:hypothetical protein